VYSQLLLFQERTCDETLFIEGTILGQVNAPGAVYAPRAEMFIKQDNTFHGVLVANTLSIFNRVTFDAIIPSGTLWHGRLQLIE
jgi:hypothetical protein